MIKENLPEKTNQQPLVKHDTSNEGYLAHNSEFLDKQLVDQALRGLFDKAKKEVADERQAKGEPLDPWAEWLKGQQIDDAEFSELPDDQLPINHPVRKYLEELRDYYQGKLDGLTPSETKNPEWQEGIEMFKGRVAMIEKHLNP
ncbi:MAG: hypothetical protein Q8P32_01765 [Candidatus Komeilibacteria bacterium]|nr:hypothetical protein [Candidatus Komeilibacteria bacterium]